MRAFKSITKFLTQKLGLDIVYFVKGGIFNTLQQVVGVILGLIVSYLFGHFVTRSVFGEYNYILSVISLITFLSLPGMDNALIQAVGKGFDRSYPLVIRTKIKFSLLGSLVLVGLGIFYFLINSQIALGFLIAASFYPFLYTFPLHTAFFTAKSKFDTLASVSIFSSIAFLILMAIGIFIFPSTPIVTLSYLTAITFPAFVSYIYSLRFIKITSKVDTKVNKYGLFLTLISIPSWISSYIGPVILGTLLGVETLAVFSVANRFLASVQKNVAVFYKPVTAKLVSQSNVSHTQTLIRHGIKFLLIGSFLAASMWISIPYLIRFFFPTYPEAIIHGQLLSLTLIPMPLSWVLSDIFVFQKRKKTQIVVSTIPHLIKIMLYFILIPRWKIYGLITVVLFDRYATLAIFLASLFYQKIVKK